jgi:two-component system nitrate/nitrite response regulator NarL
MKVLICDDHRLFSDALASVFRSRGFDVAGTACDPPRAIASLLDQQIDVCLLDLKFPNEVDGSECVQELRDVSPSTKVVVITASADPAALARAAQGGASAIVFKDEGVEQIIDVVESVQAGASVEERRAVATKPRISEPRGTGHDLVRFLTDRERETLERLVRGETGTQLAANMGINYATVRTHVQHVLTKLGVHSRLEAVAFVISNSLVEIDDDGIAHTDRSPRT